MRAVDRTEIWEHCLYSLNLTLKFLNFSAFWTSQQNSGSTRDTPRTDNGLYHPANCRRRATNAVVTVTVTVPVVSLYAQ